MKTKRKLDDFESLLNTRKSETDKKYVKKEFNCTLCEYSVSSKRFFKTHMLKHKHYVGQEVRNFCTHCQTGFKTAKELKRHMPTHKHKLKRLECSSCYATYSGSRTKEFEAHDCWNFKYLCVQCGQTFHKEKCLKVHQ